MCFPESLSFVLFLTDKIEKSVYFFDTIQFDLNSNI